MFVCRNPWRHALILLLALHAFAPGAWPWAEHGPGVAWAQADGGDDGDDGDDGDGGGASGGASADGGGVDAGGQELDPGPREPELPVLAGQFVVDELIALNPSAAALQRVRQWGARVVQSSEQTSLGLRVVRLKLPPGLDARTARDIASERDPGVFDLHHQYRLAQPAQETSKACEGPSCAAMAGLDWPADAARCGREQVIGMVDAEVATDLPALRGADLRTRRFIEPGREPSDAGHGTAVATLLVGQPGGGLPGLVPRARLLAAVPFFRRPSGDVAADALGLVRSLDWLVAERVQVIGMSLTGPPNLVLAGAIARAQARGVVVVAAVGNGGRNAEPAHPAALAGVIGATAVSSDRRIYWRAQQGDTVDFALPGVDLPTADAAGAVRPRSGTSYAVPFLVAKLSQSLQEGRLTRADWLTGGSVPVADLGAPGRDAVFGWGMPRVPLRCG